MSANSAEAGEKPDFRSATRPPDAATPEKTLAGKSIADIKKQVEQLWPEIIFEKAGRPIHYAATLETELGEIELEFFAEDAPNHVRNFIALAKAGFYDKTIFHRTITNFMIQGGCPVGTGTGGPGYCLKAEFNPRPHLRGTLSMARASDPNSAGSQFFICVGTPRWLDGEYSAFGRVTKGLEVADKIVGRPTGASDRPKEPVAIKRVIIRAKESDDAKKPAGKPSD